MAYYTRTWNMGAEDRKIIRILATSDHHGMFYPWDYLRGNECLDGSLAQVKTAVTERYDPENTLLVDAGDSIQDNSAELFYGDELHPMIMALNDIGYELWTAGNHDYDVSMAYLDRCILGFADMIIDYITNVKHGVIRPFCSNRWKVVYRKD